MSENLIHGVLVLAIVLVFLIFIYPTISPSSVSKTEQNNVPVVEKYISLSDIDLEVGNDNLPFSKVYGIGYVCKDVTKLVQFTTTAIKFKSGFCPFHLAQTDILMQEAVSAHASVGAGLPLVRELVLDDSCADYIADVNPYGFPAPGQEAVVTDGNALYYCNGSGGGDDVSKPPS